MTLPSTITTKHGEYEPTGHANHISYVRTGAPKRRATQRKYLLPGKGESGWLFEDMTDDEIIEFLLAYKEAGNE